MGRSGEVPDMPAALLQSVAEQLKLPLLQIARRAELLQLSGQPADAAVIQSTADAALRLIDAYVLGIQLHASNQSELALEPVSVSSVLYDSAHELHKVAQFYGVSLDLQIAGKFEPVLAHRQGLQAALTSLGMALIEALPALDSPTLSLQLATHRCRYGIVAGLYTDAETVSADTLQRGRALIGRSRQPLVGLSHASAAGVFVADSILQAMKLRLQTSRHHRLYGLGTVLQPNNQLQLV